MKLSFDISLLLYFSSLTLALLWSFLLLNKKSGDRRSDRILAALLVLIAFDIAVTIIQHTGLLFSMPHMIGAAAPLGFVYPPLFYLYVRSVAGEDTRIKKTIFHFLPSIGFLIYLLPFYFQSGSSKIDYIRSLAGAPPPLSQRIVGIIILLMEAVYITLSLIVLIRHAGRFRDIYSRVERYNLAWVRNLIGVYIVVTIIFLVSQLEHSPFESIELGPYAVFFFIYAFGYMGLRQPQLQLLSDNSSYNKYQKSGLTERMAEQYELKLRSYMQRQKPFYDSDLTLQKLAADLSIAPNHLSQILNERLRQNFFDFVNGYRVAEAKKMLGDPASSHLTILAIAYDAGFSSKSSFNSIFKRHTNLTPSQYKKSVTTPE